MNQGIVVCPVKGEMALQKCEWYRSQGLKACDGCRVKPRRFKGSRTKRQADLVCPECGLYKSAKAALCWSCSVARKDD